MKVLISAPISQINAYVRTAFLQFICSLTKILCSSILNKVLQIVLAGLLFSGIAHAKGPASGPSVTKMFQTATDQIRSGNFPAAEKILKSIIGTYPGYEPSYLLLARVEYRQGNQSSAFRYFKKVNPVNLDSESAFEYGLVAYTKYDCSRALVGFNKVSPTHELYNYSKFYSGVCYLRVRDYARSLKSLRQATDLPSELSALRRKMTRIAIDRIRIENSGQQLVSPAGIIAPQPAVIILEALPPEPGDAKKLASAKKKGGGVASTVPRINYSASPFLDLLNSRANSEFSGIRSTSSNSNSTTGGAKLLARYDLKATSFDEHPNLGLGLDLSEAKSTTTSSDVKLFRLESGGAETEEISKPVVAAKTFAWALKPSVGFPLSKDVDLAVLYQYQESWPDNERTKHTAVNQPTTSITFSKGKYSLDTSASYRQDSSPTSQKHSVILKAGAGTGFKMFDLGTDIAITSRATDGDKELPQSDWSQEVVLAGSLGIAIDSYTITGLISNRGLEPAPGFDFVDGSSLSKLTSSVTVNATFDFGLNLSGQFAAGQFSNYGKAGLVLAKATEPDGKPVTTTVTCAGNDYSYNLNAKYTPIHWAFFQANYQVTQTEYLVVDEEASPFFFQEIPDQVKVVGLSAGLIWTF
jgi:Tfp pilus assembly protein PilF